MTAAVPGSARGRKTSYRQPGVRVQASTAKQVVDALIEHVR
jgi:hypothetical protein